METNLFNIFGESIIQSKNNHRKIIEKEMGDFKSRLVYFKIAVFLAVLIIFIRLVQLTVVKGSYFASLSEENRFRENVYPAGRGVIYDRNGDILVRNKPGFVALVDCGKTKCFRKISHEESIKLEASGNASLVTLGIEREYIEKEAFSHLLGTTGAVFEKDLGREHCGRKIGYQDDLGRSGVEEAFDCQLQGTYGRELIEVDASGNSIRTLSKVDPKPGKSLRLSIDKNLQLKAYELMKDKKGAVVAHIPKTGEILLLYSAPSFDLSKFSEGISEEEYQKLVDNPQVPLFNRAIAGTYPPGSIYKTIIATAALEEKSIGKDTQIEDTGIITVGEFSFSNWYFSQYGKKEGLINVVDALKRSNDIFFYKTGEFVGVDKISEWSNKFLLGSKLGIELSGEEEGLVPSKKWKEEVKGEQWYLGDTYHLAIGQGDLLVTPLQVAFFSGAFANNGIICKPTVLKTDKCVPLTKNLISESVLKIVREGMIGACSEGGTAFPFFGYKVGDKEISVACKTGTADYNDPEKTHAWFTAFAPSLKPEIMVTVLVEGGGEGSRVAAPIAKEIMDEWFGRN